MSILLVDSYDSFTFNLKNLIEKSTGCKVYTIHNDSYTLPKDTQSLDQLISLVDSIVIGPGPGSPSNESDVGIIPYLYKHYPKIPILGICLGFQTLCLANGAHIGYLVNPIHGQVHNITLEPTSDDDDDNDDLFNGFNNTFESVRYHSIYVKDEPILNMKPLAYTYCPETNSRTLMAAKHTIHPHYGVQYHPESICSKNGDVLLKNFWNISQRYNLETKRQINNVDITRDSHILQFKPLIDQFVPSTNYDYQYKDISNNPFQNDILQICEFIKASNESRDDFLLLNSALSPGNWSIIGLPETNNSLIISHSTEEEEESNKVHLSKWGNETTTNTINLKNNESIWTFISNFMKNQFYEPIIENDHLKTCPFIGGLVGFFSYEEGQVVNFAKLKKLTTGNVPDTKLCFIERFIALSKDHSFVVSIKKNDDHWLNSFTESILRSAPLDNINKSIQSFVKQGDDLRIIKPNKQHYENAFNKCQEYLKTGDSYELCLTTPTKILIPSYIQSWEIYKNLVTKNPSPYSSYLKFSDSSLLSTSPERFISWDRVKSEMRPIKGTVRKTSSMTYEKACQLLHVPKEIGENLMIVDLIRHDLFQMLDRVEVSKLMQVEEYKTVYQLVSVIDGYFERNSDLKSKNYKGIDLLYRSLPPGSMTGAPKKRSVEILYELEQNERRGLYSGVCGYWSINDKSDWSVIIRSLFNYTDDLNSNDKLNCWRCGAGGAITVLSECESEWEEMLTKLDSVLQMFE
ncbi:hypothetical protein CANARDRAFT_150336 [[Candida] arabinofermentans NRRL YB-2248]|uniref:aminodeoxychorismate synthase n=1 Tax=[Candida] arabinofermentans NRRL YB-2248 TaxID=983967 RepID=A0A1E4T2X3_9ASCO|nr:hypothetical protein CANARDRAFT_150336 [[Candida] arabinofermentans NRRL YB-2248]